MSDAEEVQAGAQAEGTATKTETLKVNLPTYDRSLDPKVWLRSIEKIRKAKKWSKAHIVTQAPVLLMICGRPLRVTSAKIWTYLSKRGKENRR